MEIRLLQEREAEQIYRSYMERDFPPSELKPFSSVQDLMRRGLYEPLALYQDGALAAYAWQTVLGERRGALLDYFAVLPGLRGGGVGTQALQALAAYYAPRKQTLIIECEHPALAPDPAAARRRIGFYLRAGARATAMESLLFGVRYQIYALPCGGFEPDAELRADLEALYRAMVPEPYYRGNVIFFGG
ncbi:MAG TPA: GNAT family N-acetyltransferase [Candidatus Gemmiger faecigallinarum]|nr:GNAT family N-acetyltransferase [Candidatus Gemmiger faecigallinarum]